MTVRTRTATVLSHARPAQTAEALRALIEAAEREGVLLRFDAEETRKYGLTPREGLVLDVAIHRRAGERVAELAYAIDGEEAGSVRCDGLVLSTPAGSTGYNLANGGPVLAWGVEGFVVSFIAPHSLTARALVVAPSDLLSVHNRSQGDVDISLDGRPAGQLGPGDAISASFLREAADLAQVPGSSFYRRLRQKFGRLAS